MVIEMDELVLQFIDFMEGNMEKAYVSKGFMG